MAQYVPTWPLYEDCMFLADHIVARKTSSSYSTLSNIQKAAAVTPNFQAGGAAPTFARPSPSPAPPAFRSLVRASPSPSPSVFRPTFAQPFSSPSPPAFRSLSRASPSPSPPVFTPTVARPSPSLSPSAFRSTVAQPSPSPLVLQSHLSPEASGSPSSAWSTENDLFFERDECDTSDSRSSTGRSLIADTAEEVLVSPGVSQSSPSQSILQAIKEAGKSKRTVPELDNFAAKKKKDDDMLTQEIFKQTKELSSMTAVINASVNRTSSIDDSNATLHAFSIALKSVPIERLPEFMMDIFSMISEKYGKK